MPGSRLANRSNREAQRAHDTFDRRATAYVDYICVLQTCPYVPNSPKLDDLKVYVDAITTWHQNCQEKAAALHAYASKALLPKFTEYQREAERTVQLIAAKYREIRGLWHVAPDEKFVCAETPETVFPVARELTQAHTKLWESTTEFIASMRDDLAK